MIQKLPKHGFARDKKKSMILCLKKLMREFMREATTISKTYTEQKQRELNEKGEKMGKALGKYVISLYLSGISQVVKIKDVQKLLQDIENNLIIKDQLSDLGCLLPFSMYFW